MTHGDQPQSQEGTAPSQPKAASRLVPLQGSDLKRHLYHPTAKCQPHTTWRHNCFPLFQQSLTPNVAIFCLHKFSRILLLFLPLFCSVNNCFNFNYLLLLSSKILNLFLICFSIAHNFIQLNKFDPLYYTHTLPIILLFQRADIILSGLLLLFWYISHSVGNH